MKFNLKNVFLSVGMFVFALSAVGLVSAPKAEAAARTASVSGAWSDTATWGGDSVPNSLDAVTINTNINVTMDVLNAHAASIVINNGAGNSGGLSILDNNTLTVAGTVTIAAPSGDNATSTLAVGSGTLIADALAITGGAAASRISILTVGAGGHLTITNATTLSGTASASRLTTTGGTVSLGSLVNGGTVDASGATFTVVGTTGVSTGASITLSSATGVKTFTGNVTIDAGATFAESAAVTANFGGNVTINGVWNETAAALNTFAGDFTNGATAFTASTGVHTFSGASKTISGTTATVIPSVSITGTVGNTNTLTVATALTGSGTLTNNATGVLNIGTAAAATAPTLTSLVATAGGNVVNYTGAAPHCLVTSYDTLTFSGSGVVVCGITTGVKNVTLSGTAAWTTTSNVTLGAGGTLTIGTGTAVVNAAAYTFSTPSLAVTSTGTLTNAGTMTIASVATSTGDVVNSGTMTITTFGGALATLTNTGTLTLSGATTNITTNLTSLTADGGGTVVYDTGIQSIKAPTAGYNNLTLSGTGAKSLPATALINGTLTVLGGGTATITLVSNSNSTANKLYFGTTYQKKGTWGATAATATNETDTYFTPGVTFHMTVTLGHTTGGGGSTTVTTYANGTSTTTSSTGTTTVTTTAPTTTETPAVTDSGCSGGNTYNTNTGALCVNNAGTEIPGCGNRTTGFSTVDGQSCAGNRSTTPTTTYNFGTSTLKNGSKGAAVMELQRFLNAKLGLGLVVDGKLGPKTIAVVKQWQKDHGLVADGLIGPKTKAMMNAEAQ